MPRGGARGAGDGGTAGRRRSARSQRGEVGGERGGERGGREGEGSAPETRAPSPPPAPAAARTINSRFARGDARAGAAAPAPRSPGRQALALPGPRPAASPSPPLPSPARLPRPPPPGTADPPGPRRGDGVSRRARVAGLGARSAGSRGGGRPPLSRPHWGRRGPREEQEAARSCWGRSSAGKRLGLGRACREASPLPDPGCPPTGAWGPEQRRLGPVQDSGRGRLESPPAPRPRLQGEPRLSATCGWPRGDGATPPRIAAVRPRAHAPFPRPSLSAPLLAPWTRARAGAPPPPPFPKASRGVPSPPPLPRSRVTAGGRGAALGFPGLRDVRGERNRRFPAGRLGRMPCRGSVSELGLQWCSSTSGLAPGWDPWTPACLRLCGVGSAGQWRVPLHSRYQARAHGHFGDRSPPPGARVPPCPSLPQVGTARAGVRRRLLGSPTCPLQDRGASCPAGARVPTPARGQKTGSGGRLWPPALPTGRVF